ncbi:MAG TPA: sigma 54-interacting transcriptional regulator, partial [Vicinamibacterales bacterium]|nr:sigma 54-interacting transcriptional regulator [Vicinamibacterales bacterium]
FIKVTCGAGPADLLEASLFGYERGSLNGAVHQRPGKLEFANHGTVFFDEVAALGGALQARLLHALREGRFCRHGGQVAVDVDARVTAATSEDLPQAIAAGRFREDLLFRLNVVDITLPPLRDRPEDVRPLADHFLTRFSVHYNTPRPRLSPETWRLFEEHVWPGNVAELESTVRRLVVLGNETQVQRDVLRAREEWLAGAGARPPAARPAVAAAPPAAVSPGNGGAGPLPATGSLKEIARAAAREAERTAITRMLQRTRWNRKEAAEILGISYKALLYKIKENGLDKPSSAT